MIGPGQPIDTAPRDGTEFLAYDPVAKKFDVCHYLTWTNFFEPMQIRQSTQFDAEYGPLEDEFQPERATLWWPLPTVE